MTLELNHPEAETPAEQALNKIFKPRPCPYSFFDDEEDDFKYFKW